MREPSEKEIETTLQKLKKMFPGTGAMEVGNAYQSLVALIYGRGNKKPLEDQ
ncbi:hypothetical protein IH979_01705 [Patescibacteria group bacterium]|nr:hypothetical protein [Patescibacteria group bacterium]